MSIAKPPDEKKQPIVWIDVMRFIAAFLVILAHVTEWSKSPQLAYDFYYTISRVAVPIFFLLSGYLLLSKEEPISVFLKKRLTRIAVPFLVWSIIYDIVYSHSFIDTGITLDAILKLFIRIIRGPRGGHLWFMYFLIGLYLLTPALRVFVSKAQKVDLFYYIGLWFLAMPIMNIIEGLTPIKNAFEIYNAGGYLGYFLLGYHLGGLENSAQNLRWGLSLFLIGFLSTLAVFHFNIPPHDNELPFRSYTSLNIIIMSLGAFMLIKAPGEKASHFIANISHQGGIASFGIYLIHLLVMTEIAAIWTSWGYDPQAGNAIIAIPLVAIITFLISWLLVYLIQKIPILRAIV